VSRLLTLLFIIVVCVVGLGFYLGWFQISSDSADGTSHINLSVHQKKIQEDEHKALEKVRGN